MREFTSYGPVNSRSNFFVPRTELVESCVNQLVGSPQEDGGHYFTIWAARQTGKTWLMRRAIEEIQARHGDRFLVGTISMQGVVHHLRVQMTRRSRRYRRGRNASGAKALGIGSAAAACGAGGGFRRPSISTMTPATRASTA